MDKLTMKAFEKLQRREHFLRVARDRWALGRITKEVFRQQEADIINRYKLTDDEQRAYELFCKMQKQRKHK